ncbi:MAG: hypothetical protein E6H08_18780 [Bacteroidetes bacterium]|nr:MAG: hypothetical protein E6H08_18780 [Bacteroidota bacterium]
MENQPSIEMPRYKCHKIVHALKIKEMISLIDGIYIRPVEAGYAPFIVSEEWAIKHNPKVDGYYVVYDDGYKSFSPAKAFEEGYTRI